MDRALAVAMLAAHLGFILWVIFGALVTRGRPRLAALHVASVAYGVVAELGPWPCPLTLAENFFAARAGITPYEEPFLLHYLDAIVYPNISPTLLTVAGVSVCVGNLTIYVGRLRKARKKERSLDCAARPSRREGKEASGRFARDDDASSRRHLEAMGRRGV